MLKGKFLVNEKCLIKKCSAKGNNMLKGKFSQSFLSHRLPGHWASPESDSSSKQILVIGLLYVDPLALSSALLTSLLGPENTLITSPTGHW